MPEPISGEPIDRRLSYISGNQAEGTQLQHLDVDGKDFPYTIVQRGHRGNLPFGLGFPDEFSLFITEEVSDVENETGLTIVPFVLAHEVRETTRFADLPEERRCPEALKLELEEVKEASPEKYNLYIVKRLEFFEPLIEYYDDPENAATKTPQFIRGIHASRNHLRNLVQQIEK